MTGDEAAEPIPPVGTAHGDAGDAGSGLSIAGLTKRYGDKVAVDGVSFSVRRGQVVGLLGPNGAGKTTTMLCTAGLLRPDSGSFAFDGLPLGAERGRLVTLIAESPEVYGMLSVSEHFELVARSCRLGPDWRDRAAALAQRFGLSRELSTLGQALSKGLRQKTLIAATVLAGSPVLLLEEPMIGVDPAGPRELRAVIEERRASGMMVVLSTHLLESAQALCTHLVVLKEGRMVGSGLLDELMAGQSPGASLEDLFMDMTR
jgi:ABC-2 type transport system ATP-binding protein